MEGLQSYFQMNIHKIEADSQGKKQVFCEKEGTDQCPLFDRKVTFLHFWRGRDHGFPGNWIDVS